LGMTQEELAGELNVTRQALSNWERDVNEPDLNMLKKIQPVRLNCD
jgi:transcriptional regulator with XRE-family HTH domain